MVITINTKFNVGDYVYAFYNGLSKYKIIDVCVSRESLYDKNTADSDEIFYICEKVGNDKPNNLNRFEECDLLTKNEMVSILESALKED